MRYPIVNQHDANDCGPACLAMIATYYGKRQSIAVLREKAGTDRQGTNIAGLVRAARAIGFEPHGVRTSLESLSRIELPAIAHWSEAGRKHFVVLYKYTTKRITIGDPAQGLRKLTLEEFKRRWTGILVLLKPTPALRELGDPTRSKRWTPLLPHKKLFSHALLAAVLVTILGLSSAFFIQILVDFVFVTGRELTLNWLGAGMLLVVISRVGLQGFQAYLLAHLSRRIDTEITLGYHHHLLGLPLDFFWTRRTGEILSRLGDATRIRVGVSATSLMIVIDAFMLIITAALMLWMYPKMALVALSLIPVYAVTVCLLSGRMKRAQRTAMERAAHFEAHAVDAIGAIESVKAFRAEDRMRLRGEARFTAMIQAGFRSQITNIYSSTASLLLTGLWTLALLWLGGHEVLDHRLTVGQLMALYILLGMITGPIERLASANHSIQGALVASERLAEILNLPDEQGRQRTMAVDPEIRGQIHFQDVGFRYPGRPPVLDGLTMTIAAGECCRIRGPSGSGKSTAMGLLVRFIEPDQGRIRIDGTDVRNYHLESLRRQIATVGQETNLLGASIADNLRLGRPEATPDEIYQAAILAGVDEFVSDLPLAYDTVIGERGVTLSGGERQRLALARAIIMDPPILILDEPLSHLDHASAQAVHQIIEGRRRGRRTTIVISHEAVPVDRTIDIRQQREAGLAIAT